MSAKEAVHRLRRELDHRSPPGPRIRRRALTVILLVGVALSPVALVDDASAASTALTSQGSISRKLTGIHMSTGTREAFSSPAIVDVNGDGAADLVVAGLDGTVEAYRLPSRSRIWSVNLGRTAIQTSPAVADLNRDGRADVVVGTMDGRLVWIDGPSGQIRRTFRQGPPQHCPPGVDCRPDGFFGTPALADLNGDGHLEIIASSWDHSIYAFAHNGTLMWRQFLEDTIWSSPAVGDIDNDGRPEIVVGGDIWAGSRLGVPAGGLVWALRHNGSIYPGYPVSVPGQSVWSSPALADINGDGNLDVVVGTGNNWPDPAGRQLRAFTARNRAPISGWPVATKGIAMGSPAIGDLDGDSQLEIATATKGGWVNAYDTNGRLLWERCAIGSCSTDSHTTGSVTLADVDGDGQQEVVAALGATLQIYDGRTGALEASAALGHGAQPSAPTIGEVNGNATIARSSVGGALDMKVDLFTTGRPLCRADWPTFGRDARRSGRHTPDHQRWIPFRCPGDFVAQQYRDFLNRPLDAAGSSYWVGRMRTGLTGSAAIRSFMGSPEFGQVMAPALRLHLTLHGTFPRNTNQILPHADAIRRKQSMGQVAQAMVQGSAAANLDDGAFVSRVFFNAHGRAPSEAERSAGVARLRAGTTRGVLAHEHAALAARRLEPQVNVAMTYLGMLGRAPDAGGWSYWVPAARTGGLERLVIGFQHSPEYRNRVR